MVRSTTAVTTAWCTTPTTDMLPEFGGDSSYTDNYMTARSNGGDLPQP